MKVTQNKNVSMIVALILIMGIYIFFTALYISYAKYYKDVAMVTQFIYTLILNIALFVLFYKHKMRYGFFTINMFFYLGAFIYRSQYVFEQYSVTDAKMWSILSFNLKSFFEGQLKNCNYLLPYILLLGSTLLNFSKKHTKHVGGRE